MVYIGHCFSAGILKKQGPSFSAQYVRPFSTGAAASVLGIWMFLTLGGRWKKLLYPIQDLRSFFPTFSCILYIFKTYYIVYYINQVWWHTFHGWAKLTCYALCAAHSRCSGCQIHAATNQPYVKAAKVVEESYGGPTGYLSSTWIHMN